MSPRALVFCTVFAAASAALYIVAMRMNWAAFTYHPRIARFGWGPEPSGNGPAIYWYGWLTTAALGGLVTAGTAAGIATRVPERMLLALGWLVPLLAMLTALYYTWPFFTKE